MTDLPDPPWGSAVRVREEGDARIVTWPLTQPAGRRLLSAVFHLGLIALPFLLLTRLSGKVLWGMVVGLLVNALLSRHTRTARLYFLGGAAFLLGWSVLPAPWQPAALAGALLVLSAFELKRIFAPPWSKGEARLVLSPEALEWGAVRIPRSALARTEALPAPAKVVLHADGAPPGPALDGYLTPDDVSWLSDALEAWVARPLPSVPAPPPDLRLQVEDTPARLEIAWKVPFANLRRALRAAGLLFVLLAFLIGVILVLRNAGGLRLGILGGLWILALLALWLPRLGRLASGQGEARLLIRADRLRFEPGGGQAPVDVLRSAFQGPGSLRLRPPGPEEAAWIEDVLRAWMRG